MSKERAQARAVREAAAAQRAADAREQRERDAAERAKREHRSLRWRRLRLWQHGATFHRKRDSWAALATLALVLLLTTYLFTSSARAVLLVALILVIGGPALIVMTFERRDR
jgi:Flp pilus assembly protein TadB